MQRTCDRSGKSCVWRDIGLTLRAGRCYSLPRIHPRPRRQASDLAGAPVKQHLLIGLILLSATIGCRTARPPEAVVGPVPPNSFAKQWQADLDLGKDRVTQLHVRENSLIVYTAANKGYWLGASGGERVANNEIASPGHTLHPPVALTDRVVIPTTVAVEIFDKSGRHLDSFPAPAAIQSPAAGAGNAIYLGVSHPNSGRLAKFSVGNGLVLDWELYTTDGIVSAPAIVGDSIFAAGIDGRVWAVTASRLPIWPLEGGSFRTAGTITADLAADDFGVYVPSQDKKLYCLERGSGRIKWTYYSGMPLVDQPIIMGNLILQQVPKRGLAAINKAEGKVSRDPVWVQPLVRQVLSADEKYLYVLSTDNHIVALDKATGLPQFSSGRSDFDVFATNLSSPLIYAATKSGRIYAIRPVLKPGTVGELVLQSSVVPGPLAAAE